MAAHTEECCFTTELLHPQKKIQYAEMKKRIKKAGQSPAGGSSTGKSRHFTEPAYQFVYHIHYPLFIGAVIRLFIYKLRIYKPG